MIPTIIQAGLTTTWTESIPVDLIGFDFNYILIGPGKITIPAIVSIDLSVSISATDSQNWLPGSYQYQLIANQADDKHLICSGIVKITPNFEALESGHDFRTHNQRMLDAINSVLEGRISADVESYRIEDRDITKIPILQLEKLKIKYTNRVYRERRKASGKSSVVTKSIRPIFK